MKRITLFIISFTAIYIFFIILADLSPVLAGHNSFSQSDGKPMHTEAYEQSTVFGNFKYNIEGGKVTITGYIDEPIGKLTIPDEIDGCSVTAIADEAFMRCSQVTAVYMPSVKYIGNSAFYECTSLLTAEIPNAEDIRFSAFSLCRSLSTFVISQENKRYSADGGILYSKDRTHIAAYPSATGEIDMPYSVSIIDGYAFEGCKLIKVNMPNVHTVKGSAFLDCELLETAFMPNVQSVEYSAFRNCKALYSLNMPNLCSAAGNSFIGTAWYNNLSDEFAITGEGVLIKYNGKSKDVFLPADVKCVAGFFANKKINSVILPKTAFVANSAFVSCDNLKKIDVSDVETIENYAFSGCISLDYVEFSGIKSIGNYAFYNCSSLKAARFNCNAPETFGKGVFDGAADDFTIYYAKGTMGWTTPAWNGYPTEEFEPSARVGDLNGDSKINTADAALVLKAAAGMLNLTSEQQKCGDCNHDNTVNTADAVLILKYAAGMITSF